MFGDLVLYHREKGSAVSEAVLTVPQGLFWETCLRQMVFSVGAAPNASEAPVPWQTYHGRQAYEFCLEVISGVKSPLVGETEVFGQFKKFCSSQQNPLLTALFNDLIRDCKLVRSEHLRGLGCQSYGSAVRKACRGYAHIDVIGSGQLAQGILPWINAEENKVQVYCRNLEKSQLWLEEHRLNAKGNVKLLILPEDFQPSQKRALIISAPISNEKLYEYYLDKYELLIDLRDLDDREQLKFMGRSVSLADLFKQVKTEKQQIEERVQGAQSYIRHLADQRAARKMIRPFGWEDLCG